MSRERKHQVTKKEPTQTTAPRAQVTPTNKARNTAPTKGYTPFGMMLRLDDDIERFFDDFRGFKSPFFESNFRLLPLFERETMLPQLTETEDTPWYPQIEVFEKENTFTVRADLPGMKKEDIKVELTDNALTISGERVEETEEKREGFYRTERSYGSFNRSIPLPKGAKTDKANATFQNGVLEIKMDVPEQQMNGQRLEIKEPTEPKPRAKEIVK